MNDDIVLEHHVLKISRVHFNLGGEGKDKGHHCWKKFLILQIIRRQAIIILHLLTRIFLRANSTLSARPVMETWLLFSPLREDERLESGKWI